MSAAVLYLKRDFMEKNPNTVQALVNAFYKTLLWLDKATPEQITDNVPPEYWLGDKALYVAAVKNNLQVYSRDGIVSAESRKRSLDFLKQFDKEIRGATIDPAKTWDERFVKKAAPRSSSETGQTPRLHASWQIRRRRREGSDPTNPAAPGTALKHLGGRMALLIVGLDKHIGSAKAWHDTFKEQLPDLQIRVWPKRATWRTSNISPSCIRFRQAPGLPEPERPCSAARPAWSPSSSTQAAEGPAWKVEPPGGIR
jgi:hypothetical protein